MRTRSFFRIKILQNLIVFFLLLVFLIPVLLTGCKFEKLGLVPGDASAEGELENISETTGEMPAGYLNEQDFYDMRSLQKDKNPLTNINVRKALMYAIDRKRIVIELLGEYGSVLNSLFPQGTDYFSGAWEQYNYNPALAKEFLGKAGYNEENQLFLTIGANSESQSRQVIENIIKENLQDIGIVTWIANKESREWYMDDIKNGNYDLGIWSILIPGTTGFSSYFSSGKIPSMETDTNRNCNNFYWYNNQDFDFNMNSMLSEDAIEKKSGLSAQLQQMLAEDAVILPLYNRIFAVAFNKKLSNVEIDYMDGSFLKNIINVDVNAESGKKQNSSGSSSSDGNKKSLVAGYEQEPYVFNPLISDSIYRDYINSLILQGLWKKTGPDKFEQVLAESITVTGKRDEKNNSLRNSLKAVIKLKDDIYWQDGSPVIADDVIATINAIISDETLSFADKDFKIIKSIEQKSDKEFTLTFNEYDSNWQQLFDFVFPAKLLENNPISSLFSEDIFGCGPYKLKEWKKGEYILLEKNNYYNMPKPKIDELKFIFNSDINFLIGMLNEGNIDILSIPSDLELMKSIEENKNLDLLVQQGMLFEHLAICQKPKQ